VAELRNLSSSVYSFLVPKFDLMLRLEYICSLEGDARTHSGNILREWCKRFGPIGEERQQSQITSHTLHSPSGTKESVLVIYTLVRNK